MLGLGAILLISLFASCGYLPLDDSTYSSIKGVVVDEHGPVASATVRIQTTNHKTTSDDQGHFSLSTGVVRDESVKLTAWAPGYFCAGPVEAKVGQADIEIHLEVHSTVDNQDYSWLPSKIYPGYGEDQGCAECHSAAKTNLAFTLPVDEWSLDSHSQSAINLHFRTMYLGTDINDNKSPLTRYVNSRDYGSTPLRPDPSQPYFGPGYKLDFPDTAGNCAACHTPPAAVDTPYAIDPTSLTGVFLEGVSCDFCHKIWAVKLDPQTGLPNQNMPGVLSFEFRRPEEGHQFFAGPFDDVAPGEDTFSPLQTQSQICAPCHFGIFWDVVVYDSFGEWLRSPYSDPNGGQTCQDCHMPHIGATHFAKPENGGLLRDSNTIFSHQMLTGLDMEFIRQAIDFELQSSWESEQIVAEVSLTNVNAGHDIPTDSPLRHLILVVRAWDDKMTPLDLMEGETLPEWSGVGDPQKGYYSGLPGKAFAKVLEELWTSVAPTGAYWNPTRILYDNRLSPYQKDTSKFVFSAPQKGEVTIEVKLIYRRAYIQLMNQKGWDIPDLLLVEQDAILRR
jgi:hypothetical protein